MEKRDIWVELYKTTLKSKQNYEVRLKELIAWDKPINERDMDPAGKWSEYDKKIKALNALIDECTQVELKAFAKEKYFDKVKDKKDLDEFLSRLEKYKVVDKREWNYCPSCKKFSHQQMMHPEFDKVVFPIGIENEIWIVTTHYDGCCGWD